MTMLPHAQVQGLQCLPGVCTLHRSVASRSLLRFFAHTEHISKSTAARFLASREHKSYRGLEERTTRSKSAGAKHSTTSHLGRGVYLCVPVRARAGVHERSDHARARRAKRAVTTMRIWGRRSCAFFTLFNRRCAATPPVRFQDESHHESRAR